VATVVRWLDGPNWKSPLPICAGDPPAPITPDWAAITVFDPSDASAGGATLEFLTNTGEILGHFQFDTVEIAVDQAQDIAGIARADWRLSNVVLPDDGELVTKAMVAG